MIPLVKSTFYNEQKTKEALCDFIMNSTRLSMGTQCKAFETAFAKKQGTKHAMMVGNGSMANLVLVQALLNMKLVSAGQKAGFSALTWATNVMPLIQLGLAPVPVDCELDTLNVSVATLDALEHKDISMLFLTNVLGFSDDIEAVKQWCDERDILLIEDNCESLGSEVGGKKLGNFGLASTFSFFVGHHLSTVEGGMICTDDDELYNMLLMVRAHGWDRNLSIEAQQQLRAEHNIDDFYANYTFYHPAYNARPNEITGFLGLNQLQYWDEIVEKRHENFKVISDVLSETGDVYPFSLDHMNKISNFSVPVVCKTEEIATQYKQKFAEKMEIRPVIAGSMVEQPFYKSGNYAMDACPNASFIHKNGFYFPNNPELTEEDMESIISTIKQ